MLQSVLYKILFKTISMTNLQIIYSASISNISLSYFGKVEPYAKYI